MIFIRATQCVLSGIVFFVSQQAIAAENERETGRDKPPQSIEMIAEGVGNVPGAIVCPNFRAVQNAFRSFTAGPPVVPGPELYQCSLVPPGTVMTVEGEDYGAAVFVTAMLRGGRIVRGVTLRDMVGSLVRKPSEPRSKFPKLVATQLPAIAKSAEPASAQPAEQNPREVTARGVSVVPGAIVCPDFQAVQIAFDGYVGNYEDELQDALTHGQSRLLRGAPRTKPNLEFHACVLVAPGTPMTVEQGNIVPVVTATLPDGRTIRGVTLPAMIARKPQDGVAKSANTRSSWQAAIESGSVTVQPSAHAAKDLAGTSPKKILIELHAGNGTILSLDGVNTDHASVTFARQLDDLFDDCRRNSSCTTDQECEEQLNECISESAKEEQGKIYKVSAICSRRIVVTDLGPVNSGNSFQLWKLESQGGYPATDWKDLKTGKLTGDCSACQTPHLVSALEVLCPMYAREPVNHEDETKAESRTDPAPEGERITDEQLEGIVAKSAAAMDETIRKKPWRQGLLRALGVNPGGAAIQQLSPAEGRCHEMVERQSRECTVSSPTLNPHCTPASVQHDIQQCDEDLRQEWVAQQ